MKKLFLISLTLIISACSSGGGSSDEVSNVVTFNGNNSPANISDSNAKEIGETAGESVENAANSTSVPFGIKIESNINILELQQTILNSYEPLASLPSGVDVSQEVCSSGRATITDPGVSSGPAAVEFNYSNCKIINSDMTFTGKTVMKFVNIANFDEGYTATFINLKAKRSGSVEITLNMTLDCSSRSNCTYNSDFYGTDGKVHRVSALSFTGNATSGYNGTATFYHARYGKISITATNITYGNCGSKADGGSINFSSTNGSSGTISFASNCSVSGTWTTNTASGSF